MAMRTGLCDTITKPKYTTDMVLVSVHQFTTSKGNVLPFNIKILLLSMQFPFLKITEVVDLSSLEKMVIWAQIQFYPGACAS